MPEPFQLSPPRQPRSQRTLARIVTAGLELLEERGPDGVTVQAVVKRARSSVGSFYARFRGKEDLLAYLAQQVRDSALSEWRAAVDESPKPTGQLAEALRSAVDHVIEVRHRWDAGVRAAADLTARESDYIAFRRSVVEELASRLLERRAEITHANPDVAVRVGLWAVLGVVDHEGSAQTGTDLDDATLRRECTHFLSAYLSGGAGEAGEAVDFFDVWS